MEFSNNEFVELKRGWIKENCLKDVVSFLNTHDGTIYIGIDKDGSVLGVKNLEKTLNEIRLNIKELISPSAEMLCELSSKFVKDKFVIVINIKKGNSLYYIRKYGKSPSGCFYRKEASCKSMSDSEIEKGIVLISPHLLLSEIPTNYSDLSFNTLKLMINSNGHLIDETNFLKEHNLLTTDNKYNLLSWLVSDQNQTPLIVSIFDGKNKTNFIQRKDFGNKSLLYGILKVIHYFDAINKRFIKIESKYRKEMTSFDIDAFKEAWINACVNNKWELKLTPQVYKYSNTIEIISWGGMPNNISKEEFFSGLSKPVNPDHMRIFLKCGLSKHSGFGVPIVVEKYGVEAFSFLDDRIVVTIPINEQGFNNKIK